MTHYYHPNDGRGKVDIDAKPFEVKPDSICVSFRVNLGGIIEAQIFDHAANGPVIVRGSDETSGGAISWGANLVQLSREETSVNNGSFYSGRVYIPKDSVEIGSKQPYKFYIENNGGIDWEGDVGPEFGNRVFTYTANLVATCDTTLGGIHRCALALTAICSGRCNLFHDSGHGIRISRNHLGRFGCAPHMVQYLGTLT